MKKSFIFIMGALLGAILEFLILTIIVYFYKYPPLNTAVIEYMESKNYVVDTIPNYDCYVFSDGNTNYFLDYHPQDNGYLRLFVSYNVDNYSEEDVDEVCKRATEKFKNCTTSRYFKKDGTRLLWICSESFVSTESSLDSEIIDRSIRIIDDASIFIFRKLDLYKLSEEK